MNRILILALSVILAVPAFGQDANATPQDSLTQSLELENLQFSAPDRPEGITEDEGTYTIYDLSGRPVKTHTDKSFDQPFDLSDLGSGIYLLKMGNRTIKIVK